MTVETVVAGLLFVLLAILRVVLEWVWEGLCRWVGYWSLKLITFGRYEPDDEGWLCGMIGLLEIIAIIWAVTEWIW